MQESTDIRRPQPIFLNLSPTVNGMGDLSKYVKTIHTRKDLSTNAGTWEVELTPSEYLRDSANINRYDFQDRVFQSIRPMDCIIVGCWGQGFSDKDAYGEQHFMFGFVDGVYRSTSKTGNRVYRTVKVRGRDATKLFLVDNIVSAPELATSPEVKKAFDGNEAILNFLLYIRGNENGEQIFNNKFLPQVAYWILANAPSMRIKLDYFEGKNAINSLLRPADIFRAYLLARSDEKLYDAQMSTYSGSILNYFSTMIDAGFYELWIDTLPKNSPANDTGKTRPILILRPKPYDYQFEKVNSSGDPLQNSFVMGVDATRADKLSQEESAKYNWEGVQHPIAQADLTIGEEDILQCNLGVSDDEVFSMFRVGGQKDILAMGAAAKYGMNFPMIDAMMMHGYGLREMTVESKLIPGDKDSMNQMYPTKLGQILPRGERKEGANAWGLPFQEIIDKAPTLLESMQAVIESDEEKLQDSNRCRIMTTEKRDRLWRWNRYNHLFESGMIEIKGRNAFVGQKVKIPSLTTRGAFNTSTQEHSTSTGMEFYCMAVEQYVGYGQSWVTKLAIARGSNLKELENYYNARKFGQKTGSESQVFSRNIEGPK